MSNSNATSRQRRPSLCYPGKWPDSIEFIARLIGANAMVNAYGTGDAMVEVGDGSS